MGMGKTVQCSLVKKSESMETNFGGLLKWFCVQRRSFFNCMFNVLLEARVCPKGGKCVSGD